MAKEENEKQPLFPLYGDLLESIMSKVAMADLLPASYVSRAWRHAVASSLRRSPRVKPWMVLRLRHASVAYDPHSKTWVPLPLPLPHNIRSSHPQLLYALLISPSNLSIAQPVSATWTNLPLPRIHRVDPIVALVGSRVVFAGGATWDFEDAAPGAVESLDLHRGPDSWHPCDPIPNNMSSSATCLSVATSDDTMYVLDKNSGVFSSFDPEKGRWSRTCNLRPDPSVRLSAIGFSGSRLILAVLSDDPLGLTLWELDPKNILKCKVEIGRMPKEMVERLVGEGVGSIVTVGFSTVGDYAYLYNPDCFQEAFFYEFAERRWESIGRPQEVDDDPTARITFTCCTVGLDQLVKIFQRRL